MGTVTHLDERRSKGAKTPRLDRMVIFPMRLLKNDDGQYSDIPAEDWTTDRHFAWMLGVILLEYGVDVGLQRRGALYDVTVDQSPTVRGLTGGRLWDLLAGVGLALRAVSHDGR